MGCDLVAFGDHTLDQSRIRRRLVNRAFVQVVASHEESRLESIRLQDVEQLTGIHKRTIVVRQRHNIVLYTVIDVTVVGHFSQQRSRIVQSCGSSRGMTRVAGAKSELTIWVCAIFCHGPAIALSSVSDCGRLADSYTYSSGAALAAGTLLVAELRAASAIPTAGRCGAVSEARLTAGGAIIGRVPTPPILGTAKTAEALVVAVVGAALVGVNR